MLCFLCSFASGHFCYCQPGRPLRVMSTSDMVVVDLTQKLNSSRHEVVRRSHSEPATNGIRENFVRFRSLRDSKLKKSSKPLPLAMQYSLVSIPSSVESTKIRKQQIRRRAKTRLEAQLSSSSGETPTLPVPPLEGMDSMENGVDSPINGKENNFPPPDPELYVEDKESSLSSLENEVPLVISSDVMKLALQSSSDEDHLPPNWQEPDNYRKDLDKFMENCNNNPFADPFDSDRRSRTELWVKSTSPAVEEDFGDGPLIDFSAPRTPTGEISELVPSNDIIIHINGEVAENEGLRLKSSRSSDTGEHTTTSTKSVASSSVDKNSITKLRFRSNLHKAVAQANGEVKLEDIDRFWDYRYKQTENRNEEEPKKTKQSRPTPIRAHTPTVERVVMYYTSDKRPSFSSISPSPSQFTNSPGEMMFSFDDARKLFQSPQISPSPILATSSIHSNHSPLSNQSPPTEPETVEMNNDVQEILVEVPQLLIDRSTSPEDSNPIFRLVSDSSVDEEIGKVIIPESEKRIFISRATSTDDLLSSEGRSQATSASPHKQHVGTEAHILMEDVAIDCDLDIISPSSSVENLLAIETRPNSSSPNKSVHFSKKDAEIIEDLCLEPPRRYSSGAVSPKPILKRTDERTEAMRRLMKHAAIRLYKDLLMLVEERDRALHALEILPSTTSDLLSPEATRFQTNYRDRLLENKGALDARIDHVWNKLKELPLTDEQSLFVYSVKESSRLTMSIRRRVVPIQSTRPRFRGVNFASGAENKGKSDIEMASDYGRKLEEMRRAMIRRESDIEQHSIEEILRRVSSNLAAMSVQ